MLGRDLGSWGCCASARGVPGRFAFSAVPELLAVGPPRPRHAWAAIHLTAVAVPWATTLEPGVEAEFFRGVVSVRAAGTTLPYPTLP